MEKACYKTDKFMITCWCGIPKRFIRRPDGTLAAERFIEMKDAGINLVPVSGYGVDGYDKETVCEALALCEELGLKVQLSDERITRALNEPENRRKLLEEVVRDYSGYPSLLNYYVVDEPKCERFPAVAEVCRILEEIDPVHETYVNILGNRAYEPFWGCKTYDEHVTRFMETVKPGIISYDNYHFKKGAPLKDQTAPGVMFDGVKREKIDLPGFLDNLEEIRAYSRKYSVPFMSIILVLEHVDYRDLSEAELRYEVFTSLCSGVKRLSYFTYWEPYADRDPNWEHIVMLNMRGAMIQREGDRSHHYYEIAKINRELQAIGDVLLPYNVENVFHIGEERDNKLIYWPGSFGDVTAVTASRAELGFYEGGYLLLVNKDYESASVVSLSIKVGKTASHYNKTTGLWEPSDGALTIAAGDGELLRIL